MNKLFKIVLSTLFTFPLFAMESGSLTNYFDSVPEEVTVLITHNVIRNSRRFQEYGPFLLICKKTYRIGKAALNHGWALEHFKRSILVGADEKETTFFTAIRLGALPWLMQAISQNQSLVNQVGDCLENTPLIYAADCRSIKAVQLLLDNGASINESQCNGWTALHVAADRNSIETVKLLLKNNADATLKNRFGLMAYDLSRNRRIALLLKIHSYKQYSCSIL